MSDDHIYVIYESPHGAQLRECDVSDSTLTCEDDLRNLPWVSCWMGDSFIRFSKAGLNLMIERSDREDILVATSDRPVDFLPDWRGMQT